MTVTNARDLEIVESAVTRRKASGRTVVAIMGAPGSGKSTIAETLEARLNAREPGSAAVLPMDGYHLDDGILIARGQRARKGSPETFDVGGLLHMLDRLKRNDEEDIAVPVFDRALEISRAGARLIPRSVRSLIVEGNYLLLDAAPWTALHARFDITVAVLASEETLRSRLTARWRGYGLSPDEIGAKVETNDLPNGRFLMANSIRAKFSINNDTDPRAP